jgi:PhnB protein
MSSNARAPVSPIPEHLHTVTPRLVVRDGAAAIDFYGAAFAAEEIGERFAGPGGEVIHAEVRIGNSIVMVTEESGDNEAPSGPSSPECVMATYWEDVDAAWEQAVAAGAEVIHPLADHFYGERGGRLRDPLGHQWMLSQRTEQLSHEEMNRRAAGFFGSS